MKKIIFLLLLLVQIQSFAQDVLGDSRNRTASHARDINTSDQAYKRIYEYDFVDKKPIFKYSKDTLRNFYMANFTAFDSLAAACIEKGDTAKYIRVHFEFTIDENGVLYDGKYLYTGSTRYAGGSGDKKIKYLDDQKAYLDNAIKKMVPRIPSWYPALQNNIRVKCAVKDYFQFWLGINPEPK